METKNYIGFDPVIIGDTLRKLREKKKMTQMEVVQAIGVSYCHYARVEEAAVYFHIGHVKIRSLVDENPNADFIIHNGSKVEVMIDGYSGFLCLDEKGKPLATYHWEKRC